ncbi:hypothetical protein [Leucothrix pacifica]|uniref:hypothetical protein n=1 Tax=Leucothrix pacifica TaxID=1247513 RepID=UPI0015E8456D|nr:hypothetical protein [Leucothrix pacifica]
MTPVLQQEQGMPSNPDTEDASVALSVTAGVTASAAIACRTSGSCCFRPSSTLKNVSH